VKRERYLEKLTPICQLITYGLLVVSVLFMVYTGAALFRRVTIQREKADHLRATVSYVQNQICFCEDKSAIYLEQGPEGDMLCLPMNGGQYEIRIYQYENSLREELSMPGMPAEPADAEKIAAVDSFEISLEDNLARIRIDGRSAFASLRSQQGGAP